MKIQRWEQLDAEQRQQAITRPTLAENQILQQQVAEIVAAVKAGGDSQLIELTRKLDQVQLEKVTLEPDQIAASAGRVSGSVRRAINDARGRIEKFHQALIPAPVRVETATGVVCERVFLPIEPIGLYVPAGTAPLPSTALMLGIPARLAGCERIVLCSPPTNDGLIEPTVAYVARELGIGALCPLGGAQAIAAMAYGSETIPACNKIFGPGNAWVTAAKQQVSLDPAGALIDLPAGPSELLVIADSSARADFIAADLLSQAEHGPDSQVLLVTPSKSLAESVLAAIEEQLSSLSRAAIARQALIEARFIVTSDLAQALEVSNLYAPEHLSLQVAAPRALLPDVTAAGSIFLGHWAPEAIGDYCSGANHVLPTNGYARATGGLSVSSFMKAMTVQELTPDGLAGIGETAEVLARAEGLTAHQRAVSIRRQAWSEEAAS